MKGAHQELLETAWEGCGYSDQVIFKTKHWNLDVGPMEDKKVEARERLSRETDGEPPLT